MPKRPISIQPVPPSLTATQAVSLLKRQIERLDSEIANLEYDDPKVEGWLSTTMNILDGAYGKPDGTQHPNASQFYMAGAAVTYVGMPRHEHQEQFLSSLRTRRELLLAYIEQLQDLAPPSVATAATCQFHPEIERVSGPLSRDGHYKQAALEAYIRVIEEVKARSGLPLDGDGLMNRAFGVDNQIPVLKFNTMQSPAEVDEQRGLMFLFKGIVGLRNSKAHSNRLFNDPNRAHDYLSLASLLMRLLEIAQK